MLLFPFNISNYFHYYSANCTGPSNLEVIKIGSLFQKNKKKKTCIEWLLFFSFSFSLKWLLSKIKIKVSFSKQLTIENLATNGSAQAIHFFIMLIFCHSLSPTIYIYIFQTFCQNQTTYTGHLFFSSFESRGEQRTCHPI